MPTINPVDYFAKRSVLTVQNVKFQKSGKDGLHRQVGLTLAPAMESGLNTCAYASPGCRLSCLKTTPRQRWPKAKRARILRTYLVLKHRETALKYLKRDLERERLKALKEGRTLVVRLNTMSDLPWETLAPELFHHFVSAQFIDYTKNAKRYHLWLASQPYGLLGRSTIEFPENYHLTFSRSEVNEKECIGFLRRGGTVTLVVRDQGVKDQMLKAGYKGFPCVDGDLHDRRWEDPAGHWVVLTAKGKAKTETTGFVVDAEVTA